MDRPNGNQLVTGVLLALVVAVVGMLGYEGWTRMNRKPAAVQQQAPAQEQAAEPSKPKPQQQSPSPAPRRMEILNG
jgi:hypothetical protein